MLRQKAQLGLLACDLLFMGQQRGRWWFVSQEEESGLEVAPGGFQGPESGREVQSAR